MAGMYGLGRVNNPIAIAAGQAFSLKQASGAQFLCTGNDTFTLTVSPTFGGSYVTPGNIITRCWTNTSTNGTAAWVDAIAGGTGPLSGGASNAVAITSGSVIFEVLTSQVPSPDCYLKVSVGASGLVMAQLFDLTVKRDPANLTIPGA